MTRPLTDAEIAARDEFEERAAILEYDAKLPRGQAERLARLQIKRKTIGSVEGTLEAISIHRSKKFIVYDALTKKAISCEFGDDEKALAKVKDVLGKRVMVSGTVHWNAKSEARRVDVADIRVLGAAALPRAYELSGTYPEITEGLSTEDYIRSIRGD